MNFQDLCNRAIDVVPHSFGEVTDCSVSFNRIRCVFCVAVNVQTGVELPNVRTFESRNIDLAVAQVDVIERLRNAVSRAKVLEDTRRC